MISQRDFKQALDQINSAFEETNKELTRISNELKALKEAPSTKGNKKT